MRILGILAVAAAVAAQAADPPAPPVDSIAAAKRDFAAIKAAPGDSGALSADRAAKPEAAGLPAADPGPPERSLAGANPAAGGTGNWLVDAMERKPGRSAQGPGAEGLIPGGLDLVKAMGSGAAGEGAAPKAEPPGGSGAKVAPDSVINPLDAFMGGWISARDKALLLPDRRMVPFLGAAESGMPEAAAAGGAKEAANPYVAGLNPAVAPLGAPAGPSNGPLLAPDLSGPSLSLDPTTKLFEVPRLEVPDLAQPNDDDKYFRQMRRF